MAGEGLGHVAGPLDMWQGVGACGMGWWHVAGCGLMYQGVRACGRVGACDKGYGHLAGGQVGICCRGWVHVAGCGSCGRGWGHVTRARGIWQGHTSNVKKSNMLTMNEVHKNFNLIQ